MKKIGYRATLKMECGAHGSHVVRLYSTNDCMAILTADSEARKLSELGHSCTVVCQMREGDGWWEPVGIEDAIARDLGEHTP